MQEALRITRELFDKWNESGICYCHWKSNEHLYEGLIGKTDLDVLVKASEREKAEKILSSLNYVNMKSQYGSRYQDVTDWIGCDIDTGNLIHIHLHFKLLTGHKGLKEYDLPFETEVLNTRVFNKAYSVYTTDPNYEIILLMTRIVLKASFKRIVLSKTGRFSLSDSDKREIAYLIDNIDESRFDLLCRQFFSEDAIDFKNVVLTPNYDSQWFSKMSHMIKSHIPYRNRYGAFSIVYRPYMLLSIYARSALRKYLQACIITKKVPNKGMVVAFIGQDGAGKSTVSDNIKKWLTWKIDAQKFYLGSGDHYTSLQKILRKRMHGRNKIVSAFKNLLTVSDLKKISRVGLQKITKARKYADNGGIAIFDRYPQKQYPGINDGPKIRDRAESLKLPVSIKKILMRSAAKEEAYITQSVSIEPDLVIKMILEPEESIRRKPQERIEDVRKKHEVIKNLEFTKAEVITVRADMDFDEEIRLIRATIWNHLVSIQGRKVL